jgi:hypothetical protein
MAGSPQDLQAVETVDLASPGQPTSLSEYTPHSKPWDPDQHKAQSAKTVAMVIVGTFTGSIALVLIAVSVIMGVTDSPDDSKRYADTLVTILESLGNFLTAVFAPLLAFVLGFYFGEKRSGQ